MRGKSALLGAVAVLLSSTSVYAADAKAPQDNGQQAEQAPQGNGNTPPPARPKVRRSNALIPGIGALIAAGAGGAAAAGAGNGPNSP